MKKIAMFFLIILTICTLTACHPGAERIDWENFKLGHILPTPQSNLMEIISNDNDILRVYIYKTSENDYLKYQRWCEEEKGFNIESESTGDSFYAYNREGYCLSLDYYDGNEMHITLEAPIPMEEVELPGYAISANLPLPVSKMGHYKWKEEDGFLLYVGETSKEEYLLYKDACVAAGFMCDPYEYQTVYSATNEDGYKVSLNYKGFKIFELEFSGPEDERNQPQDTENEGENKKIVLSMSEDDFDGMNYADAEKKFRKMGFANFEYETVDTEDKALEDTVCYIEITEFIFGDSDFSKGDEYDADSTITFYTYKYEEPKTPRPVFYSTNDYETAKKGNAGVFSYKNKSGAYDVYWIIDFDEGYVYFFTDGNGETFCDKVKIASGHLNDRITITWNDGRKQTNWYLHFKYVNMPETLVVNDHLGIGTEFTTTDLDDALSIRNTKIIKEY